VAEEDGDEEDDENQQYRELAVGNVLGYREGEVCVGGVVSTIRTKNRRYGL
jgi:hypothetical protein